LTTHRFLVDLLLHLSQSRSAFARQKLLDLQGKRTKKDDEIVNHQHQKTVSELITDEEVKIE